MSTLRHAARRRPGSARLGLIAIALAAATATAGCQADRAGPEPGPASRDVVVASFAFGESDLLAEIYAQALEAAGVPVRRELGLGPRELVLPALRQGLVHVVPEYLGTLLSTVAPRATVDVRDVGAVRAALDRSLRRWGLRTLEPSAASNQNGLVVTRATALRLDLAAVSDLRPVAPRMTLGMTPECPSRRYCLVGLREVYGLDFGGTVPFPSERQRAEAVEQRVVDVAVMFTTDGRLATDDLVLLRDDRRLQPVENVVPVVSSLAVQRHGARVVRTLNRVSAELTTAHLVFLNWRVDVAGRTVDGEARGWLRRHDLLTSRD